MEWKIPKSLIQIGVIAGVIVSLIVGAPLYAYLNHKEAETITAAEFKQFCALNDIAPLKCKVKKVYGIRTR